MSRMNNSMIKRWVISALGGILISLVVLVPARGAYFPDPVYTPYFDMLQGDIFNGTYGPSSEVAGWDQNGVLRFRADISTDSFGSFFWLTAFYGPPSGSIDPYDFTWQIYDGSALWSATIHQPGTTWTAWQGQQSNFQLNRDRGNEPLRVVPEPATLLVLGLLGGSGLLAGLKNKGRRKR